MKSIIKNDIPPEKIKDYAVGIDVDDNGMPIVNEETVAVVPFSKFAQYSGLIWGLWFLERRFFFFKRNVIRPIWYGGVPIQIKNDFMNKYLKSSGDDQKVNFRPINIVEDLYKFLKKDDRNFWMNKDSLKQQDINVLYMMVETIVSNLWDIKKKNLLSPMDESQLALMRKGLSEFLLKRQAGRLTILCANCQNTV